MSKQLRVILIMFICLFACGHDNTPEGVADAFLFRYFIELNQRGALEFSTGLAEEKLNKEIELTQNIRMTPDLDLAKHRPFIDYKLMNIQRRRDDVVTLFYDVTIENPGGADSKREIVVTTTNTDGVWKVNNFDTFTK